MNWRPEGFLLSVLICDSCVPSSPKRVRPKLKPPSNSELSFWSILKRYSTKTVAFTLGLQCKHASGKQYDENIHATVPLHQQAKFDACRKAKVFTAKCCEFMMAVMNVVEAVKIKRLLTPKRAPSWSGRPCYQGRGKPKRNTYKCTSINIAGNKKFRVEGVICLTVEISRHMASTVFGVVPKFVIKMIPRTAFINKNNVKDWDNPTKIVLKMNKQSLSSKIFKKGVVQIASFAVKEHERTIKDKFAKIQSCKDGDNSAHR